MAIDKKQQKLIDATHILDGNTMKHFWNLRRTLAKLEMARRGWEYGTPARIAAWEKIALAAAQEIEQAVIGYMVRRVDIYAEGENERVVQAIKDATRKEY
jgi:hypothetical protein